MSRSLDDYIDVTAILLGLPIEDDWKASIRANLDVTFRLAQLVDEFPLPDEAEPADVFHA